MDPIQLPEDITLADDEMLAGLDTQLTARSAELRALAADSGPTTELAAAATETVAAYQAVRAEIDRRTEAAAAVASLSAVPEPTPPAPAIEPAAEPAPVPEAAAPVQAAVEPVPTPEPAAAAVEVLTPDAVIPAGEPAPISPAALSAVQNAGTIPATPARPGSTPGSLATMMRATRFVTGNEVQPGQELNTRLEVATAIGDAKDNLSRSTVLPGARDFVSLAHADWRRDFTITKDAEESLGIMWGAIGASMPAILASGPCCTPLSPMYDFCRLGAPQSPVEDCLPVMGAPRGGIRFLITPDWRDALAGIGRQCCGDNDDPDNPVLKPCVRVECPEEDEVTVCAISQCVEFDNLQYRTFPELIANFLDDLAIAFAMRKEIAYLDTIHASSTLVTGFDTGYGAVRQFVFNLILSAEGYRRRNRMAEGAPLSVMAPAWVKSLIKADMAMDHDEGLTYLTVSDAQIAQIFAAYGLSVCWYVDSATVTGQSFDIAQAAGNINNWPDFAVVYLFSPGTFVRLDGGTLDVGLVRDSVLNRRNDLQMFMEEWTAVAQLCPESIALVIPMCPNGAAVEAVTAFAC